MEDWTEKYRPTTLDDVVGNEKALAQLRAWARQWYQGKPPKKKAVILTGKAGIGKTSSALALAQEYGWTIIELNASDARNAAVIKRIATSGAVNETFDLTGNYIPSHKGGRKLIILDEADNLYDRIGQSDTSKDFSDRGGKKAIVDTVKNTQQPIILIVNDYYQLIRGSGEPLKQLCETIPYYPVSSYQIVEKLRQICTMEHITVDVKTLQALTDRSQGDVRSAINDLQTLTVEKNQITIQSLAVLGHRDREKIIFDGLRDIFKNQNIASLKTTFDSVDMQPDTFLLWISENVPREYQDIQDMNTALNAVSRADVFFGRVFRRQDYGFWSYACDLMGAGVAVAKTHRYRNTRYYPPGWMKELKQQRGSRNLEKQLAAKIAPLVHCSLKKIRETTLPMVQRLCQQDIHFTCKLKQQLELTEPEVRFLLGSQLSHKVKEVMESCVVDDTQQQEITMSLEKEQNKQSLKDEEEQQSQPSLLDF